MHVCTEVCRLVVQCNRQMGVDSRDSVQLAFEPDSLT